MWFTIFNGVDILRHIERPDYSLDALGLKDGESFVDEYLPPSDYYVSDGDIVPRPEFPIVVANAVIFANEVDQAVFTGIPAGTVVSVQGMQVTVDDGTFSLTADMAGDYPVSFSLYPYRDKTINVTATDPA